jgi:2-oxoglutarate ferredoxin oxidoreductase subunit gamma
MDAKIIIAGAGGQGVMLLGKIIAEAAMLEKKFVTWLPAYGAEVRGGTANCMVIISGQEIGSPFISQADSMIILNEPSFQRFKGRIKNKGIMLVNSSLVNDAPAAKAEMEKLPFTDTAFKLGSIKAANMVALGAFVAKTKIVKKETIFAVIQDMISPDKPELFRQNTAALKEGIGLIEIPLRKRGL